MIAEYRQRWSGKPGTALGEDSRSHTSWSEATAFLLNGFFMPKKPLVILSMRGVSGFPRAPNLSWMSSKLDVMAAVVIILSSLRETVEVY